MIRVPLMFEHVAHLKITWIITCTLLVAGQAMAVHPRVVELEPDAAETLFNVQGGSIEQVEIDGEPVLRWRPQPGQRAVLELDRDHLLFATLRYYDRLQLDYRIESGQINSFELAALGHVSGPRQYKIHQFNLGIFGTETERWHYRDVALDRPFWFPWDDDDGYDAESFFHFEAVALTPDTTIELRNMRLVRSPLYIKPDYESPITWPRREHLDDGGVRYTIELHVLNASHRPTDVTAEIASSHERFTVTMDSDTTALAVGDVATFTVSATLDATDIEQTPELYSEPVRITFTSAEASDAQAHWEGRLVRPLSPEVRRQAVMDEVTLSALREAVSEDNDALMRALGYDAALEAAETFTDVQLLDMPRSQAHPLNRYPNTWRPTGIMPEAVNTETEEREFGTRRAGRVWREHLANAGKVPEALGNAYLWTGEQRFAEKAIELFEVFAQHYAHEPWNSMFDVRWYGGAPIQTSSRISGNSSYGTNMHGKWLSLLASMAAESETWNEDRREAVYEKFVLPYATELTKMHPPISNMSDITNHNLMLLGLAFDDARMVWHAVWSDTGVGRRLEGIDPDGFSSEGRPLNYHFAGMREYVDTLMHMKHAGLAVDLPIERLLEAVRMPYRRATLWGAVPNAGDAGRWQSVERNSIAGRLVSLFPDEAQWLVRVGGAGTPAAILRAHEEQLERDPEAWRDLVPTEPTLFSHAGLAILRQGQTPEEQVMITLDYGPSLFHGALDRNQITLAAHGRMFSHGTGSLYNVGRGGMERINDSNLEAFIGRGSLGHNVILVDARNQQQAIGELLAWSDDTQRQVAVSRVRNAYPGVTHTRGVMLVRGVVLLFDRMEADDERMYDFVYHNFGELTPTQAWRAEPYDDAPLAETANYPHIKSLRQLHGEGVLELEWDLSNEVRAHDNDDEPKPPVGLRLWQLPIDESQAFIGETGMNNPNTRRIPDATPTLLRRVNASHASFVTVLDPHRDESQIERVEANGNEGVTVHFTDGERIEANLSDLIDAHRIDDH